jgi:hypothetical protein
MLSFIIRFGQKDMTRKAGKERGKRGKKAKVISAMMCDMLQKYVHAVVNRPFCAAVIKISVFASNVLSICLAIISNLQL